MAVAKRPDLLILDEPMSALDPLARREFLQSLMESVTDNGTSVIISSHVIGDLERICDYFMILIASRVRLAGDVDELRASHRQLIGPRRESATLPDAEVITARHTERQTTLLVRGRRPVDHSTWTVADPSLEDVILSYMKAETTPSSAIEVLR